MSKRRSLPFRRTVVVAGVLLLAAACAAPQNDRNTADDSAQAPAPEPVVETAAVPEAAPAEPAVAPAADSPPPPQILGTTDFRPPTVSNMRPTGTVVGKKIESLRGDLLRLQGDLSSENGQLQTLRVSARQFAGNYHSLKAAMNARLQVGTTPGNPELVAQWNQAQSELQQVGTRNDLYHTPANVFVADFIGEPPTNFFEAELVTGANGTLLKVQGAELEILLEEGHAQRIARWNEKQLTVGIRPQALHLGGDPSLPALEAEVAINEYLGERSILTMVNGRQTFRAVVDADTAAQRGDKVRVHYALDDVMVFSGKTELIIL